MWNAPFLVDTPPCPARLRLAARANQPRPSFIAHAQIFYKRKHGVSQRTSSRWLRQEAGASSQPSGGSWPGARACRRPRYRTSYRPQQQVGFLLTHAFFSRLLFFHHPLFLLFAFSSLSRFSFHLLLIPFPFLTIFFFFLFSPFPLPLFFSCYSIPEYRARDRQLQAGK